MMMMRVGGVNSLAEADCCASCGCHCAVIVESPVRGGVHFVTLGHEGTRGSFDIYVIHQKSIKYMTG